MEEQLVSFETAKLAKLKGFDFDSSYTYNDDGFLINGFEYNECFNNLEGNIVAVTQSLLQKYLRDEHDIIVEVHYQLKQYKCEIIFEHGGCCTAYYNTWEEALEAGLQKALTLI